MTKKANQRIAIAAFIVLCLVLCVPAYFAIDWLDWDNRTSRVILAAIITIVFFVLNILTKDTSITTNIPPGVKAVGPIAVFLILVFAPTYGPKERTLNFRLQVVDEATNASVNGALAKFSGTTIETVEMEDLDGDGEIEFVGFLGNTRSNEKVTVRVESEGFEPATKVFEIKKIRDRDLIFFELKKKGENLERLSLQFGSSGFEFDTARYTSATGGAESLFDLYKFYNLDIVNNLAERLSDQDIRGVTIVTAPGGYGKSLVIGENIEQTLEVDVATEIFKLSDLEIPYQDNRDLVFSKWYEGEDSEVVLSSLPELNLSNDIFSILGITDDNQQQKRVIVIDDFDEIHENSSSEILVHILSNYMSYSNTHFILLGREEAFYSCWEGSGCYDDHIRGNEGRISDFQLKSIEYRNYEDVLIRVKNICELHSPETCEGLSVEQIAERCALILEKYPEIRPAFSNLRMSFDIIGYVVNDLNKSQTTNIPRLKSTLIDLRFEESKDKHGRPDKNSPRLFSLYQKGWKAFSEEYHDRINSEGEVAVRSQPISFDYQGATYTFIPQDLLNYSGFIVVEPSFSPAKTYRFQPPFFINDTFSY
jgi:hypothetical protein